MWGVSHSSRSAVFVLYLSLLLYAQLPAQSRAPHKAISHATAFPSAFVQSRSSNAEPTPASPFAPSFSHGALPGGFRRSWIERSSIEQSSIRFTPSPESRRQAVNFALLLPATSKEFKSATATRTAPDRGLILPTSFGSEPPPPDRQIPERFNDPQFYTRRIPGVGPIVDRVFEESKAHPRLTRVIKMIQPKF
jgi:hypothetical protein